MKRPIVLSLALLILAGSLPAAELPPGRWWRRPEVAQRLSLSEEQRGRLDGIFRDAANDLIDRKADVDKLNVALRAELDQPQLNRQNIQRVAARLNEVRGRLFERELMMLVDMRAVMTDEQWRQIREHVEAHRPAQRPGQQRRP